MVGWHGGSADMAHGLAPSAQHGSLLLGHASSACYSTRLSRFNQSFFRQSHRPKWEARPIGQVYKGWVVKTIGFGEGFMELMELGRKY